MLIPLCLALPVKDWKGHKNYFSHCLLLFAMICFLFSRRKILPWPKSNYVIGIPTCNAWCPSEREIKQIKAQSQSILTRSVQRSLFCFWGHEISFPFTFKHFLNDLAFCLWLVTYLRVKVSESDVLKKCMLLLKIWCETSSRSWVDTVCHQNGHHGAKARISFQ